MNGPGATLGRVFPEGPALRTLFAERLYLAAYFPLVALVGFAYAILLAGLELGGFGLWVLNFLTPPQAFFALAAGVVLPLVFLLNLFVWRHPTCLPPGRPGSGGLALPSVLLGILPNALCCTPIIPTILALFLSGSTLFAVSPPIQHFLAVDAPVLYALSALAMWASLRVIARRMAKEDRSHDTRELIEVDSQRA